MGMNSAAVVISQMKSRFALIEFIFVVGIEDRVSSLQMDIWLSNVVISHLNSQYSRVIQYDFRKIRLGEYLIQTGFLNTLPTILLSALVKS